MASALLTIVVYGMPGPQGSKKFVGRAKSGRGIMVESSKKVRPWREAVKFAAADAIEVQELKNGKCEVYVAWAPIDQPVRVRMVFTLPKPGNAPKRKQTFPCRKPDVSKLARSTEDALTDAGVWKDDARVVEYSRLAKVFPNEDPESLASPGVRIVIEAI